MSALIHLLLTWLDSSSYDDRVAAATSLHEISTKLSPEDFSPLLMSLVDKLHALIAGKYFNNKEEVVLGFMSLVKVGNLCSNQAFVDRYVGETCLRQVQK
jgi:hypothetical protein